MPNLRSLKSVKGVSQEVLERLFKALSKESEPLLRTDKAVNRLVEEGFTSERKNLGYGGLGDTWGEATGLHYADTPEDLAKLITGGRRSVGYTPNVQAYPLPGTRGKKFSPQEWQGNMGKTSSEINKTLSKDYDFIKYPDLTSDQPSIYQTVQLNPNKSVAKINTGKESIYKILGLAGALGVGEGVMNTDEANAMPIGKLLKAGTKPALKAFEGAVSSAAKPLIGKTLEGTTLKGMQLEGKAVHNVTKGSGEWRNIIFNDGSSLPVTKDYLNDLMREVGTQRKMIELNSKDPTGQLQQALKSLEYHKARQLPVSKGYAIKKRVEHRSRVSELLNSPTEDVVVVFEKGGSAPLTMPRKYAEILEREGKVRIDRTKTGVIE